MCGVELEHGAQGRLEGAVRARKSRPAVAEADRRLSRDGLTHIGDAGRHLGLQLRDLGRQGPDLLLQRVDLGLARIDRRFRLGGRDRGVFRQGGASCENQQTAGGGPRQQASLVQPKPCRHR